MIEIISAVHQDLKIIQNLSLFYYYEMSKYTKWNLNHEGLFQAIDLSRYGNEQDRHLFLIKVNKELAGFALVNKVGSLPSVDWTLAEFFILGKFQGQNVGRTVAFKLFKRYPGIWEVRQFPENSPAIHFWNKVVDQFTKGAFTREESIIEDPYPHVMIILRFQSFLDEQSL